MSEEGDKEGNITVLSRTNYIRRVRCNHCGEVTNYDGHGRWQCPGCGKPEVAERER